jgi:hypothetical protein
MTNMGSRYNQAWKQLAPPQLSGLSATERSMALWVWINREEIQCWWNSKRQDQRDKWGHPATIRIKYEQDHPSTVEGEVPQLEERTEPRTPFPSSSASHGAVLGMEIDRLHDTGDRLDDAVDVMDRRVRECDLSTPEMAAQGARIFWRRYREGEGGVQGIKWFIDALQDIVRHEEEGPPPPSTSGNGHTPLSIPSRRGNGSRQPLRRGN